MLAILCNFGTIEPEMVIEEIFIKLRSLQESNLSFQRSVRQLDMLSLLRGLQLLILKQEQKMALTLDIEKDLRYRQGLIATATEMIKKGFDNNLISEITKLSTQDIQGLRLKLQSENKKKK